ncbi:unnamed protein product (macronuclear) [Paramecium tetraurelia]|uniref:CNH domain-containing protein n=1 Tax=Paramecium tetraurelia TaxID=5888 RepID=A0CYU9_PARTE|nr:uncharacterized protein GSPATT00011567001 [Paramecium tetraurelia]CAK75966.1 unnamed protein product [Paramecium tetraurelia]|eukprot:XP_001443363.1 hypothetical protein (macronuclear) [Paramecium tetraurelia strain d4-2]
MQIITGDETGLLKLIDLEKKEVVRKYGEQGKEFKIIQILTLKISDISFFLVLREESLVLLDNELNEITQISIDASPLKAFCDSNHDIYIIYTNRKINHVKYDQDQNIFLQQANINSQDFLPLTNCKDKYVTSAAISNDQALLLVTYFGAPPSIFNLKQKKLQWQSRNVKNDELDLQVKMHDYDGLFLDDYSVGVITTHLTLRIYSILEQRSQPVAEHSLKHSKTKIKIIRPYNEKYYMINERGEILIYKKNFTFERMIKGTFGAVRDVAFNKEYIYTVSIDRFLRVYHNENVRIPLSINLSQRLQAINFYCAEYKDIEIEKKQEKIWTIQNVKRGQGQICWNEKTHHQIAIFGQDV